MARILILGGCGYVGAALVPVLLAKGHDVTVLDMQFFGDGALPAGAKVIKADIRTVKDVNEACAGRWAVILLASISSEAMCQRNPLLAETTNVIGALNVALAAKAAGVERFIYASSVAAYGSSDEDVTEGAPMNPTTMYGQGKMRAENRVHSAFPEATIVRSASVCGTSPHMRLDLTVNMMVHDAMRKGVITVNGGQQKRCHVHIQDLCEFYCGLLDFRPGIVEGQAFNVVNANESVQETASLVARTLRNVLIEVKTNTDNRSYTVSGDKARDVLHWTPKRPIEQAIREMKAAFDAGEWPDSLTNPVYQNEVEIG